MASQEYNNTDQENINLNYCKCGCGNLCQKIYIHGHNQKGKKLSKEHIEKVVKSKVNLKYDRVICQYCDNDVASNKIKRHEINCQKKDHSIHYCQCGCNQICNGNKKYIHGHNMKNKPMNEDHKRKIGRTNKNQILSEEQKQRLREINLKRFMKDGHWHSLGLNEKELLDKQELIDNCKIDRNFTVVGYHPDGYCKETNTVYEVYEKGHDNRVFEDLERENRICRSLNCDFIILYDRTH